MKRKVLAAGSFFVAYAAASAATASDFTINVPLVLTNLPNATAAKVYCSVTAPPDNSVVGNGSTRFVVVGGKYSGTVTVAFDAKTTKPPGTATQYSCFLGLEGKAAKGTNFESSYSMLVSDWLGATGQTITINPSNPAVVNGALPGHK